MSGNVELLNFFIENSVIPTSNAQTALHQSVLSDKNGFARRLIELKWDVNALDEEERSPLYYACALKFNDIACLLLDSGADFEFINKNGESAVSYSRDEIKSDDPIFHPRLLWSKTIPWVVDNNLGEDLVMILIDIFMEKGFDINHRFGNDSSNLLLHSCKRNFGCAVYALVEYRADPSVRDIYGNTPLHYMCHFSDPDPILELMTLETADVNAVNNKGQTVLHILYTNEEEGGPDKILRAFIWKKFNLNAADNDGNTIIHLTAASGKLYFFEYFTYDYNWTGEKVLNLKRDLLDTIDFDIKNNLGKTAMDLAVVNEHSEVVELLLQFKSNQIQ